MKQAQGWLLKWTLAAVVGCAVASGCSEVPPAEPGGAAGSGGDGARAGAESRAGNAQGGRLEHDDAAGQSGADAASHGGVSSGGLAGDDAVGGDATEKGTAGGARAVGGGGGESGGESGGAGGSESGGAGGSEAEIWSPKTVVVSDDGVAFTDTPTLSYLTETLYVTDGRGGASAWKATTDAEWLSVTAEGAAGEALRLTADPTGLSPDTIHYARVRVFSKVENDGDVVRVGFWVGSSATADVATLPVAGTRLVTDPIRPYAYVQTGEAEVSVYNVYTGELVTTHALASGRLGEVAVSTDGSELFVVDTATRQIVPIALDGWAERARWALDPTYSFAPTLAYVRTGGLGLLLATDGHCYRAADGQPLASGIEVSEQGFGTLAASLSGNRYCWLDSGYSPFTLTCHTLALDGEAQVVLVGPGVPGVSAIGNAIGSYAQDVALSPDGSRVYVAARAPSLFFVYDAAPVEDAYMATIGSLPGVAFPNNVQVSDQGLVIAASSAIYDPIDLWLYDDAGELVDDHKISQYAAGIQPRQVQVSGDGQRLAILSADPLLTFLTTGPNEP